MLPGVVALELVLARSALAAVCVTRLCAYGTGFEFDLLVMTAPDAAVADLDPRLFGHRPPRARTAPDEGQLRFGVQFADGAKATNLEDGRASLSHDAEPRGPVLMARGGGGGERSWRSSQWVWPLPPAGALAFVCAWSAASIPQTRHEIDAQVVLDAAARAQEIFPPGAGAGGAASSSVIAVSLEPRD